MPLNLRGKELHPTPHLRDPGSSTDYVGSTEIRTVSGLLDIYIFTLLKLGQ